MDNQSLSGAPGFTLSYAEDSDWEDAMDLAWRTFKRFEADDYGEEGTKNFLYFISSDLLYRMFLDGEYRVAVAKANGVIVGVSSLRNGRHVSLLFVEESFQKMGIGRALLSFLQQDLIRAGSCIMTVNAAPYAVPFYEKAGFKATAGEQRADGIKYVPMMCFEEITV